MKNISFQTVSYTGVNFGSHPNGEALPKAYSESFTLCKCSGCTAATIQCGETTINCGEATMHYSAPSSH